MSSSEPITATRRVRRGVPPDLAGQLTVLQRFVGGEAHRGFDLLAGTAKHGS